MSNIDKIKSKISKLLAMASEESNASESEIQTAIIKARELMIKYKLSEIDFYSTDNSDVVEYIFDAITYSSRVNPWIHELISIIADNYCCYAMASRNCGAKTRHPGLIGVESDVSLAKQIFNYAIEFAFLELGTIKQNYKHLLTSHEITSACNSWGNGFVVGLKEKFDEQNKSFSDDDEMFELALSTPKEVEDFVKPYSKGVFDSTNAYREASKYTMQAFEGYLAGKNLTFNQRISAADE